MLSWRTGAEVKCGSFEIVVRALVGDDVEPARSVGAIGCEDSLTGASYRLTDPEARGDRAYRYTLREHETDGFGTSYVTEKPAVLA